MLQNNFVAEQFFCRTVLLFNIRPLTKGVAIEETEDGIHQIMFKNWAEQGTVTCQASNYMGSAECKADLSLEKSNLEKNYSIVKEEYRVHSGWKH